MKVGIINIALQLFKLKKFKKINNILDMGSKELRLSFDQLDYAFKQADIKYNKNNFKILKKFPKGKRISSRFFWQELGIKNYKCLDINREKGSFYCDLNFPIKNKKLFNSFDLITDFGNNEHVFNVGEAYKSMYEMCKKDGLMWIFQSVYNGNGFFNFDQSFFEGLAAANDLSIVYSCYLVHISEYQQYVVPCHKDLLNAFDLTKIKNISISYIFRKTSNKKFSYYYQYNVNNNIDSTFTLSFINSEVAPEKIYVPTKKISELKANAKKGNIEAKNYLRALGIKVD